MRVLHFAHSYIPQYGGTTTRLINLLSNPEHEHYLYVPEPAKAAPAQETIGHHHVRRCRLRAMPPIGWLARWSGQQFMRQVIDSDFDLVQGHNPAHAAWAGLLLARQRDVPFVYEMHRLPFDSFGANRDVRLPGFVSAAARSIMRRDEKRFFENAEAIIVQTTMHRDRIVELFRLDPARIHVIPMGVDEDYFDPARWTVPAATLRQQLGGDDRLLFLYNGYLGRSNGIEMLVQGVQNLPVEVRSRVRLIILGRGPLKPLVQEAARANPELIADIGLVNYDEMPAYYAAADVVLIPLEPIRIWECNNPTKLLEAMAMERLVLASDVGGVTELMRHGETGLTFKPGDPQDFQRRLMEIVSGIDELRALGRRAREHVVAERRWSHCRTLLDQVYERFTAAARPAGCHPASRNKVSQPQAYGVGETSG